MPSSPSPPARPSRATARATSASPMRASCTRGRTTVPVARPAGRRHCAHCAQVARCHGPRLGPTDQVDWHPAAERPAGQAQPWNTPDIADVDLALAGDSIGREVHSDGTGRVPLGLAAEEPVLEGSRRGAPRRGGGGAAGGQHVRDCPFREAASCEGGQRLVPSTACSSAWTTTSLDVETPHDARHT